MQPTQQNIRQYMIQDLSTAISRRYCDDLSEMRILEVVRNALQDVDNAERATASRQRPITATSQTRQKQIENFSAAMQAIGDH